MASQFPLPPVITDDGDTSWLQQPQQFPQAPPAQSSGYWLPQIAQGVWNSLKSGATLPGDVATGQAHTTDPNFAGRVTDMTGLVSGGSALAPAEDGALNMGIKAYHGSPHSFDQFDMSKIGTGEGAQAYGHGLYFADSEGVAKSYRDQLSPVTPEWPTKKHEAMFNSLPQWQQDNINGLMLNGYSGDKLRSIFQDRARTARWEMANPDDVGRSSKPIGGAPAAEIYDQLASMKRMPTAQQRGSMYQVDINADPEHFLDWDKPLSEQTSVYEKLKGLPQVQSQQAMLGGDRLVSYAKDNGIPPLVAIKLQSALRGGADFPTAVQSVRSLSANPDWAGHVDKLASAVNPAEISMQSVIPPEWTGASLAKGINGMGPEQIADTLEVGRHPRHQIPRPRLARIW